MVCGRIIIKNYLEIVSYFFAYYTKNVVIFFTDHNIYYRTFYLYHTFFRALLQSDPMHTRAFLRGVIV